MIRTRDLLVFIVVLLVLSVCIGTTLVTDVKKSFWNQSMFTYNEDEPTDYTVRIQDDNTNRQDNIERLRNLLAKNDTVITPSPSVETVAPPVATTSEGTSPIVTSDTALQSCGGVDADLTYARSWPLTDVFVIVKNGERSVVYIAQDTTAPTVGTTTSTSSQPAIAIETLLQVPVSPVVHSSTYCVPSDVIGVTAAGSLIYNSDAGLHSGRLGGELIGYARDGFPIYGPYSGQTDSCGGYQHASGYRYTVPVERNFILGCFVAPPATFQ